MTPENNRTGSSDLRGLLARWVVTLLVAASLAICAAWRLKAAASELASVDPDAGGAAAEAEIQYWTCTMHPEVRQDGPGKCPRCSMELVPKYVGSDQPGMEPAAGGTARPARASRADHRKDTGSPSQAWYRCTMPECGDQGSSDPDSTCPVCGMKRERVDSGEGSDSEYEIRLNDRAIRLAEIETEPVSERLLFNRIRTVGRVDYDETRYKMASAWIGGRIDKLFADFTGMSVSKGDHLVEIYSPELLSAQEEYLQAYRAVAEARNASTELTQRSTEQLLRSARRKLELLGITGEQIETIERSNDPLTHMVVYAPIGGTITEKRVMEGMYVKTGDTLYAIADLTHLWLMIDLYEADLPWVKPFQDVRVSTRSLPGETFHGRIMFIEPRVDPKTRTVSVRVHVDNPELKLKPDMWVTARIDAWLSHGARAAIPMADGDYACPMHPWEISDGQAACPVCSMNMQPIEQLGRYPSPTEPVPLLSVPRTSVMQTGERALVYVETAPATYYGVEVRLGPLARGEDGRDHYPILAGLAGTERVVTRGGFAIDSQMQLAGKPSLFNARGFGGKTRPDEHEMSYHAHTPPPGDDEAQTLCPVMGNKIDTEVYTDYKDVRVYFCCPPCIDKFQAEPDKYIPNLPAAIRDRLSLTGEEVHHHD